MPDYGEIFCEAVNEVVKNQLRGLHYDLTQVCQIDNVDERDKGIYWVSNDSARFKAYSQTTTYEVGDTVYVTTPNNDNTQQKIITGKKVIGSQQDITYVMPFNNITNITGNLIKGSREQSLLANGSNTGLSIPVWTSEEFETGYTRLGLQGSFRSQVGDAVEGSYGLKLVLGAKGTTDEVKEVATFYLDADDMYGNPYNFDGYYIQQKVFDISNLAGFDDIKLYFYQGEDFKNSQGEQIISTDGFGNALKSNLFVNDLQICLGYDVKDLYEDGLILYCDDGLLYDTTPRNKKIEWRFIQFQKNKKIKLITTMGEMPHNYKLRLYKYNPSANIDLFAGANWESVIINEEALINFSSYTFTTESDQESARYKAVIVYKDRPIYESNILEFKNTADLVAAKIEKLSSSFHIQFDDYDNDGKYYLYENSVLSSTDALRVRKAYPAFLNTDGELDYINGVDRVKWIVPYLNTMINLSVGNQSVITIPDDAFENNESSLEEFLQKEYFDKEEGSKSFYFYWRDKFYIYILRPNNKEDQKISYKLKSDLNTGAYNNKIICSIKHNNATLTREETLIFNEKIKGDYKVEVGFVGEEVGFSLNDWDDEKAEGIKKQVIAKVYSPSGKLIENAEVDWDWYIPEGEENNQNYFNPFNFTEEEGQIFVFFKEKLTELVASFGVLIAKYIKMIDGEKVEYYGYLPIKVWKDEEPELEGVVENIQANHTYNEEVYGKTRGEKVEELIASIKSTYGEDDPYKPEIEDGQLKTNPTEIEDLKALYSYEFRNTAGELIATIPAFNFKSLKRKSNTEIELPVEPPKDVETATFSMRRNINNSHIIRKSDLSSGYLKDDKFNGVVIGEVQQAGAPEFKYGVYGFQNNDLTFAVDEDGHAMFKGDISGASGEFSGTLNATTGNIGGWYITKDGLIDESRQIELKPGKDGDKSGIWIGGFFFSGETLVGDNLTVDGINVGPAIADLRSTDVTVNKALNVLDTELQAVEDIIYKESTPPSWSTEGTFIPGNKIPSWQEIEFITDIDFNNKTFTKKKIKVLATGAPVDVN